MSTRSPSEIRKASVQALKSVYYIVVGLAVAEALSRTFLREGAFVGVGAFRPPNVPTTILLLAFLPTLCRFVHGASIHLDAVSEQRFKPAWDFLFFLLQASLFYIMAIALGNPPAFTFAFAIVLVVDAIWLLFLGLVHYLKFDRTAWQWLLSDVVLVAILVVVYALLIHKADSTRSAVMILVVAWAATWLDYRLNKDFYFPVS